MSEQIVRFTESRVREWCNQNDDEPVGEEVFNEQAVPGLMLLDSLSSLVHGLDDGDVVLSGRFRDPVLIGESVNFTLGDVEEGENMSTVEFEARVEDRDSLVATGVLSVVFS